MNIKPSHSIPQLALAFFFVAAAGLCLIDRTLADSSQSRPNVLLILVDDLKPAMGAYGDRAAKTPNLDALAARGMRFDAAYCNQAVCAPSRFTLMLGSHSTSTGLYGLGHQLRSVLPEAVTMPQHFAAHGYRTESLGKIFHIGHGNQGDPESFSVPHFHEKVIEYNDPASTDGGKLTREEAFFTNQKLDRIKSLPRGAAFESPVAEDEAYADGRVAKETVKRLRAAKLRRDQDGTPFFIALGFARPHLPFSAPKKYWDLYDKEVLPMPHLEDLPRDAPEVAGKRGGEISNYEPVPERKDAAFDPSLKRDLIHGYYASVSYVDAQIGKVIAALDQQELTDNTIVVLWGDHGFHLGDLGIWTKHTNYEQATRIPLLISGPGIQPGLNTKQLTESVDVFPTLTELAGLPASTGPQPVDGVSLVPVLGNPDARVRDHAFHAYPKRQMGRAIRTDRYRMVQWKKPGANQDKASYELYDYQNGSVERRNLADQLPDVLAQHQAILAKYDEAVSRPPKNRTTKDKPANKTNLANKDRAKDSNHRPDMVVFLSDDHTWRDSSVYGSPDIKTPNMARLAGAGMTFDHAYVASPSCAPSRAAMLTGLFPANNGAEPNHSRPNADIKKLPAYLQSLGYEVVSFGKVGHYRQTSQYGFDLAKHFGYHEDVAVPEAIKWLKQRKSDKPLCLFVGSNWPHVPWPDDIGDIDPNELVIPINHVQNDATRQWRAKYAAAIATMDRELGNVYDTAKEVLGDDVFFLHTSDHGAQWPFAKWNLYDDGVRTPMIVSWPGKIAAGVRSDAMVSWVDLLPTLVDVASSKPPTKIDGRSFLPVLTGKTESHRSMIFTTHSGDGDYNVYPSRSVRTPDGWKYIRNLHPDFRFTSHTTSYRSDGQYWETWVKTAGKDAAARNQILRFQQRPPEELYRVDDDPFELKNRIDDPAHAKTLATLRQELDQWLNRTNDTLTTFGNPQQIAPPKSPNVITVFIDDMGYSDLSSFGGKRTTTENIDRLASEGLKFTNFYVNSPICSPSRTALTTGQYPQRWKIHSYLANRKLNRTRGMAQHLDPSAPVLARQVRRQGYYTGHFGKWHVGGQRDVGKAPLINRYGFDRSLTNFEGLGPRVLGLKNAFDGRKPKLHDLGSSKLPTGPVEIVDRDQVTVRFVERAIQHIDDAATKKQPFFINLWPDDVHGPWFPPEELRKQTDQSKRQLYYAVLDAMDQQLGKLFDRIHDDPVLRQNTLILVMSDNGHEAGAGSSDPLRGAKTWLYEGGIRSPLIVWGPGLMDSASKGTVNESSILSGIDINRSLYELTGAQVPADAELDGENLIPTLLGKESKSRSKPIFWRRPPDRPGFGHGFDEDNPDLAVRDGRWKYLVNYDKSDPQLYDLNQDESESNNVASANPQVVERLQTAIENWNASLPIDAGDPAFVLKP